MRRTALAVLIVAIVAAAVAAVLALFNGGWSDLEFRVVLTSAVVALSSILTMACGAAWESGQIKTLPLLGGSSSLLAGSMTVVSIWVSYIGHDAWWKILATAWIVGVAATHASLMALARVGAREQWVVYAAFMAILTLSAQLLLPVWFDGKLNGMALAINSVIVTALSLVVPLLHKMHGLDTKPEEGHYACPSCGQTGRGPLGSMRCESCGTRYHVAVSG
jgi:hypothetical protein